MPWWKRKPQGPAKGKCRGWFFAGQGGSRPLRRLREKEVRSDMKAYREVAGGSGSAAPAFLVGTGRNRQWHTLFDSYCERPHCPGGEAVIRLRREGAGTPELTFLMDLREGTIEMGSDDRQEAGALAESFARDQWRLLARRRQVVRAWGAEDCRPCPIRAAHERCGFGAAGDRIPEEDGNNTRAASPGEKEN